MDEATLLRLAGNFARMTDIGERADAKLLNSAAAALSRVGKEFGVRVIDELEDTAFIEAIRELLTLSEKDSILDAYLLSPHDGYVASSIDGGESPVIVNSRFLVVDARHPANTEPGDDGSTDRIRACFLLVVGLAENVDFPPDPAVIFPYYVISEVERSVEGGQVRESQWSSCVVHSNRNEIPLASFAPPKLNDDPSVCAELTKELNKAVQFLG